MIELVRKVKIYRIKEKSQPTYLTYLPKKILSQLFGEKYGSKVLSPASSLTVFVDNVAMPEHYYRAFHLKGFLSMMQGG